MMKVNIFQKHNSIRVNSSKRNSTKRLGFIPLNEIMEHSEFINSNPNIEQYFTYIQPYLAELPHKRNNSVISLISNYFTYFTDFFKIIKQQYHERTIDIIQNIGKFITYLYFEEETLLYKTGDSDNKFYIILYGYIDIIIPKQKQSNITIKEYYRYLAILIGYNENELLRRSLEDNYKTFPIEIIHEGQQFDFLNYIKDNKYRNEDELLTNKNILKIQLIDLFQYLENEEIQKINKHGFIFIDMKNSVILKGKHHTREIYKFTSQEYIFINNQYLQSKEDINPYLDESKIITVYIYEYEIINRLGRGQTFGDISINRTRSIRTTSIITSNDCHLCYLERTFYLNNLREAFERNRKIYLIFIISTYVFRNFSFRILHNYFYNHFKIFQTKREEVIINEGPSLKKIMLFKEGIYEITLNSSLNSFTTIIKYYFDKIKKTLPNKTYSELLKEIKKFQEEDKKIEYYSTQIDSLNKFFNFKKVYKLFTINVPDLFGFESMNYVNDYNLFTIKCISNYGEYLIVDWNSFELMGKIDNTIFEKETKFCLINNKKILKRIISLRQISITTFFTQNKKLEKLVNLQNKNYINDTETFPYPETEELKVECKDKNKKKSPLQIQRMNSDKIITNINDKKIGDITVNQINLYPKKSNSSLCIKFRRSINSSKSLNSDTYSYSPSRNILFSSSNPRTKERVQKWLLSFKNNTNQSNQSKRNITNGTNINDISSYPFSYTARMSNNQILNTNSTSVFKNVKRRNNRRTMSLIPINKESKYFVSTKKDEQTNTRLSSLERQLSSSTSRTYIPNEIFTIGEYQAKKKEKYIIERQRYLKENTKNIFLRNITKIIFNKRKRNINEESYNKKRNCSHLILQ